MRNAIWVCVVAACAGPGDGGEDRAVTAVRLPQAIGEAMWVNPDAYATIPVRAIVEGEPTTVTIWIDQVGYGATHDGATWTADVPVAALASGSHALTAEAHGVTATAELVVGREGIAWTHISLDGNASTPRLHRVDDRMFVTWTSSSDLGERGTRRAWLQEIDGAGRERAPRVSLVGGTDEPDVLSARTAFGASTIGVLYQQTGGPYRNYFTLVDPDGTVRLPPIALDPLDRYGSYSGDVVFTGTGFDLAWRTNEGMGSSDVRWMHVDEATGAITGPVVAAAPGNHDPHAGFDPFTNVTIQHHAGASLIAFARYRWDDDLELDLARCQLAVVTAGVASTALVANGPGWSWDRDCRILDDGTGPVVVRSSQDLASTDPNPPDLLFATRVPLAADRGNGRMIVSAPETRLEPTMIGTASSPILAWTDARSYAQGLTTGEVEIYAAVLGGDLAAGANVRFAHTRLIENTGDLRGVAIGSNAMLTWIDERHGGSIVNPRPEVYLETVWQ